MKCKCIYVRNSDLPSGLMKNRGLDSTEYDLNIGSLYDVYAQYIFKGAVYYLIDPRDDVRPNWYPADLFSLVSHEIPENWKYNYSSTSYVNGLGAIWGYSELIEDEDHCDDLFDRSPKALAIFYKRKIETQEAMVRQDKSKASK